MRISDWSSDVCSSDLSRGIEGGARLISCKVAKRAVRAASLRAASPFLPFVLSLSKHRPSSCGAERKNGPSTRSGRTEEKRGNGFTLVEMMIALSIFAAIAAMGVGLLRSSVDTQDAVQARLQAMGGINRLRAVMANDLAQAVPRSTRGPSGETVPAFLGSPTGFAFVHAGEIGSAHV